MSTTDAALLAQYGEGLADALIAGDPEVDMERFGLKVEGVKKVYVVTPPKRPNDQSPNLPKVAYGVTLNEHVYLPDGTEKEVRPEQTTTSNIATDGIPIRWTGKLIPRDKARDQWGRFSLITPSSKPKACFRSRSGPLAYQEYGFCINTQRGCRG